MKKKYLILGLVALFLVSCLGFVIWQVKKAGTPVKENPAQSEVSQSALTAPTIELKGNVVSWDLIKDASKYEVYINGTLNQTIKENEYPVDTDHVGEFTVKTKAVTENKTFLASTFSNEVIYIVTEGHTVVQKLNAPVISMSGKTVKWKAVDNASEYRVLIDGTEVDITKERTYLFSKIEAGTYKITVTALNPSTNYTESNPSNEVKHTVDKLSFSKPILVKYTENNKKTFVVSPNEKGEMVSVNINGITDFAKYTWYLEDAGNGAYYVKLYNGYYLTRFSNGDSAPEVKAAVKEKLNANQLWKFVHISGNSYKIQNVGHMKDWGNTYYYGEWYGVYKFADGVNAWSLENVETTYPNKTQLPAPVALSNKMTVSWKVVPGATGYEVYVNGKLTATVSGLSYTVAGTADASVYIKAVSSAAGYVSSYASNLVLCTTMFSKPLLVKHTTNDGKTYVITPNDKGEMVAVNTNGITDFAKYTWYPEDAGNGGFYIKLYNGYYLTRFSNGDSAPEAKAAVKEEGNLNQQWKFVYVSGHSFKIQNVGHMKDWGNTYYYGEWYGMYKFSDGVNAWSFENVTTPYPNRTKLSAPVISSVNMTVNWNAVPGASEYEVYVNGKLAATVTGLSYTAAGTEDVSVYVKAASLSGGYESSYASNTVLCTNMFSKPILAKYTENGGNTCVVAPNEKGEMVAVNTKGITDFAPYTWYFENAGNGTFYIKLYNGYYLTRFSNYENAPEVKAAAKVDGNADQQWKFVYTSGHSFKIQNVGHMNDWGNTYYYGEWFGVYKFTDGANSWSFENVKTLYPNKTKLSAPAVSAVNMTASWNAVTGATGYEVYVNGKATATVTGLSYTVAGTDDVTVYVKAISTTAGYENSYISNIVSCSNMFAKPLLVKYTTNDGTNNVITPNEKGEMVSVNTNGINDFAKYTWYPEDAGNGAYYIKLYNGYYLTRFSNGDGAPEVKAALKAEGSANQQWKFIYISGHSFKIQNVGHMNDWGNYYYGEWYGVYKFADGVNAWSFENVTTPYPNKTKLSAPVVSSVNMTASWDAVPGAAGYEVYVNGKLAAAVTDLSYTVAGTKDASVYVKAVNTSAGYENSYISNTVSCSDLFAKPLLVKYKTNDGNAYVITPNEKGEMVGANVNGISNFAQYAWYSEDAGNGAYYVKLYNGYYLTRFSNGDGAPEAKAAPKVEGSANQQWKFVYVSGNSYKIQNVGHMNDWGNYYYGEWYGSYKFADNVNAWTFENVNTAYPNKTKLAAPVISSNNMTVSWNAVAGAVGYEVYVNGNLAATVTDQSYTVAGTADAAVYVRAVNTANGYENSYVSNTVSCSNLFAKPLLVKHRTNDGNTYFITPNEKGEMVGVNTNGIPNSEQYTWYLEDAGNGAYYVKLYNGYYLTRFSNIDGAPESKAAPKVEGNANQQWKFTYVSGNSYKIQNVGHMNDWGNYFYGEWYGVYKFADGVNAWSFENVTTPYPNKTKLSAPVISSNNMTVSWNAVAGAAGYEVYVNGTLTATVTDQSYTVAGTADVSVYVKAVNTAEGYENSYLSNTVSCSSLFAKPLLVKHRTNDGNAYVITPNEKGEMVGVNTNGISNFAQYTWYLEDAGNGVYYVKLYNGYYLTRFSNSDGTPESKAAPKVEWSANQQWKFVYVSGNSYKIQNVGHMNDWGNYYYGEWYGAYKFADNVNAWTFENVTVSYPNKTKLSAPVVSSNNMTVSWSAVAGAAGYEVYVNGTLTATVTDLSYTVAGTADVSVSVKAVNIADGYENSYLSNTVSCSNLFAKPLLVKHRTNDGNAYVITPNANGEMVGVNTNGITDFAQYTWYLEDAGNGAYYVKLYSGLYLTRFSNSDGAPEAKAAPKIEGNANQQWKFVYVSGNSYKIQNVGHINDWGNYYYGEWYGVYKFAAGVNAWTFEAVTTPFLMSSSLDFASTGISDGNEFVLPIQNLNDLFEKTLWTSNGIK